jgi:hypothetical protein
MSIDPRRLTTHTLALGSAVAWGLVEFIALTRVRWVGRRQR